MGLFWVWACSLPFFANALPTIALAVLLAWGGIRFLSIAWLPGPVIPFHHGVVGVLFVSGQVIPGFGFLYEFNGLGCVGSLQDRAA